MNFWGLPGEHTVISPNCELHVTQYILS